LKTDEIGREVYYMHTGSTPVPYDIVHEW